MESPTRTHSWWSPAETACCRISLGLPPSVLSHSQIHMPFPVSAAVWEVHAAGAFTGGRDVTRTAGCHGGGEGGSGECGGTGQPASATGPEVVVGAVVVVGAGCAPGCVRRLLGRVEASDDRA